MSTKLRILVVDDEDGMRELMKDVLEFAGHEAFLACDGQEAWELVARGGRFNYFISDTDMGTKEKGGLELLRRLRLNQGTRETPFILTSGRMDADDGTPLSVVVSLYGGPTVFLPKPVSLYQLLALFPAKQVAGRR